MIKFEIVHQSNDWWTGWLVGDYLPSCGISCRTLAGIGEWIQEVLTGGGAHEAHTAHR